MGDSQMIIFDLDDTLLDTSHQYYSCRRDFVDLLSKHVNRQYLVELFERKDAENLDQFGYAPWRYAYTMAETYNHLVKEGHVSFSSTQLEKVIGIGQRIEQSVPNLRSGAKKTLSGLSDQHHLAILTRGEEELQRSKVQYHDLDQHVSQVEVVSEKEPNHFRELADEAGFPVERTWSVGDSPRWDIELAIQAGLNAILIDYTHDEYDWDHEQRSKQLNGKAYQAESLCKVEQIIQEAA